MIVAEITEDNVYDPAFDSVPRTGIQWTYSEMLDYAPDEVDPHPRDWPRVEFKIYDDDANCNYTGWLRNDPHCYVQDLLLNWAMVDVGATYILVYVDGEWTQEIS